MKLFSAEICQAWEVRTVTAPVPRSILTSCGEFGWPDGGDGDGVTDRGLDDDGDGDGDPGPDGDGAAVRPAGVVDSAAVAGPDGDGDGDPGPDGAGDGDRNVTGWINTRTWLTAGLAAIGMGKPEPNLSTTRERPVATLAIRSCQLVMELVEPMRSVVKYSTLPSGVMTSELISSVEPNWAALTTTRLRSVTVPGGALVDMTRAAERKSLVVSILKASSPPFAVSDSDDTLACSGMVHCLVRIVLTVSAARSDGAAPVGSLQFSPT